MSDHLCWIDWSRHWRQSIHSQSLCLMGCQMYSAINENHRIFRLKGGKCYYYLKFSNFLKVWQQDTNLFKTIFSKLICNKYFFFNLKLNHLFLFYCNLKTQNMTSTFLISSGIQRHYPTVIFPLNIFLFQQYIDSKVDKLTN